MSRPVAFQVGRGGEVAGGMTQVVNGYLSWPFERFDTDVIVSRDGSRGFRGAALAVSAAVEILWKPRGGDVVVVHLSERGSFIREGALLILARIRGLATVAHLHGSGFVAYAHSRPRTVKRVLRSADVVIGLSDATMEVARKYVKSQMALLIPNSVAMGSPAPKARRIVFGGAVGRRKGVDTLVTAWQSIQARHPDLDWELDVIGPIIDDDIVPPTLNRARFVGAIPHAQLMELLDSSSIAVLPSRDEAMPMFILEAMSRSNAVVASTVGGIPTVLRDGAGVLVAPGDTEGLASALEGLLLDDEHRLRIAARGRSVVHAQYSAAALFPEIERAWDLAISNRNARRRQFAARA